MQLSKRLGAIANLVPNNIRIADIGTDHGYIPIYLRLQNQVSYCIASDINKGPLESAKRNMAKYQVTGIETRQGGGLSTLCKEDQIDVVIIAGMGGYLIHDILENDLELVKGMKKIILQPQNNLTEIRKYIHEIGFKIEQETFLEEDGKYYTIIVAVPGIEKYEKECEYVYGKYLLEHATELYQSWLNYKGAGYKKIIDQLKDIQTEQIKERIAELEKEYALYREAITCIQ